MNCAAIELFPLTDNRAMVFLNRGGWRNFELGAVIFHFSLPQIDGRDSRKAGIENLFPASENTIHVWL